MVQLIVNFFKKIFSSAVSDSNKSPQIKPIELRLSKMSKPIYKNGNVQVVVAQDLYTLYSNTGYFIPLLDFMRTQEQSLIKNRVYDALIKTGYTDGAKEKLDSLTYENRKTALDNTDNRDTVSTTQMQTFLSVQKDLQSGAFLQIEKTLKDLELFYDLCTFNFIDILKCFDTTFSPMDTKANFASVPCESITNEISNLYFITASLHLTGALARAISAIESILPGKTGQMSQDQIMQRLKKIATVLNGNLSKEVLGDLILIGKNTVSYEPERAVVDTKPLEDFALRQKAIFNSDTERLNIEHQDKQRQLEIREIFGSKPLVALIGYSQQNNDLLQKGSSSSFLWITPLQIIKTFMVSFFTDQVQALLNDIVVEGFFNVPEKKKDFSETFFECQEIKIRIEGFENTFARGEKYDTALLLSYIKDSQKDAEFSRTLGLMVTEINLAAKKLIQNECASLYELYTLVLQIVEDSRKSTPEFVSNIKFLFTSSRNREAVEVFEKSLPRWALFLNLMRNYAHLGQVESPREEKRQQDGS